MKIRFSSWRAKVHAYAYSRWYDISFDSSYLYFISLIYYYLLNIQQTLRLKRIGNKPNTVIWSVTNLTIGGNAKTPMVLTLVKYAKEKNIDVVILTRGYKRKRISVRDTIEDAIVTEADNAYTVGDEAKMMSESAIVYCVDNPVSFLRRYGDRHQLWLLDDLFSQVRAWAKPWWMIDAYALLGNKKMLPAGPLRFPISWQRDPIYANLNIVNTESIYPVLLGFINLLTKDYIQAAAWNEKKVTLVTGVARPLNILNFLIQTLKIDIDLQAFADHEVWSRDFTDDLGYVFITRKDAARIDYLASNIYIIDVEYVVNKKLKNRIEAALNNSFFFGDS